MREQFFVLLLERERAVQALASIVPDADGRKELLKQAEAIVGAGGPPTAAERDRLARLSQVVASPAKSNLLSSSAAVATGQKRDLEKQDRPRAEAS